MDEDEIIDQIYLAKPRAKRSLDGRRIYSESLLRSIGIDFDEARDLAESHGGGLVPPADRGTALKGGQMIDSMDQQRERELDIPDDITGGSIP